jgi:hypothetical protein
MNDSQILGDKTDWTTLLLKPNKLWVVNVSARLAAEHGLGKQSFPPQGNQPACVKILRMKAPNAHFCC